MAATGRWANGTKVLFGASRNRLIAVAARSGVFPAV